jgi:hypothetical protein
MRAPLIVLVLAAVGLLAGVVAAGRLAGVVRRWRCAVESVADSNNNRQAKLRAWTSLKIVPPYRKRVDDKLCRALSRRQVAGTVSGA